MRAPGGRLMRAHAARGERGMAIQTYERCRAVLADLLDAAPSPETQRLLSEIRNAREMPARGSTRRPPRRRSSAMPARAAARGSASCRSRSWAAARTIAHLAPGLAEEITAALARFRWMFLVSSSSLARMAAQTRDEGAIRRAFGIDFLLDGTVQPVGQPVRITIRLLDLRAGNQVVWARRFDRQLNDILTPAGRDRLRGGRADRPRDPAHRGEARRRAARPPTRPPTTWCCAPCS